MGTLPCLVKQTQKRGVEAVPFLTSTQSEPPCFEKHRQPGAGR